MVGGEQPFFWWEDLEDALRFLYRRPLLSSFQVNEERWLLVTNGKMGKMCRLPFKVHVLVFQCWRQMQRESHLFW